MSEISDERDVFINGRAQRGRSRQLDDGTYTAYDLSEAYEGAILSVETDENMHRFIKTRENPQGSALENWTMTRGDSDEQLGGCAVKLVVLERDPSGVSFLTSSGVLSEGSELGYAEVKSDRSNVLHSLGVIAGIACQSYLDRYMQYEADEMIEAPERRVQVA